MSTSPRQALQRRSARRTPLKLFLKTQKISVSALANYLGLSRTYLSAIINGWATRKTVQHWGPKIADALEVEVHQIFPKRGRRKES